jgi:hypothetical protein
MVWYGMLLFISGPPSPMRARGMKAFNQRNCVVHLPSEREAMHVIQYCMKYHDRDRDITGSQEDHSAADPETTIQYKYAIRDLST